MGLEKIVKKMEQSTKSMQLHCIYENIPYMQLIPFGDVHYGDKASNIIRAKKTVDWIKKHEYARVILMGDLLNSANKGSIGAAVFDEDVHGQDQLEFFEELLRPIKDKIYGSLIGNHEFRVFKDTGYNVTKLLAKDLDHKYYGFGAFLKINVKNNNYVIYCTHGSSGATLPYTKIKKLLDMSSYIDADIYLMGHVHSLQIHTQEIKRVNKRKRIVERQKKYYVLTGHYLNYEDSYAEMKNMRPDKQGSPTIILGGDKKEIRVIL